MNLRKYIREIKDFPKPGINFYDITTLLEDKDAFRYAIDEMAKPFENVKIDKVVGIDARGFLFASAIAYKLGTGLSIVRKKGKLPYKTKSKSYDLEYGSNVIEMHEDTIKPGEKVLLVDDVLATGGTMQAAVEIIEKMQGEIVGISFLSVLTFLEGKEKLGKYKIFSLVEY